MGVRGGNPQVDVIGVPLSALCSRNLLESYLRKEDNRKGLVKGGIAVDDGNVGRQGILPHYEPHRHHRDAIGDWLDCSIAYHLCASPVSPAKRQIA